MINKHRAWQSGKCRSKKAGFTLLEILIVLVILGIAATFSFMAFGDFGLSRKATVEAEQLVTLIKVTQQRAILEMTTFGIGIHKNGYQFFRFTENNQWQTLSAAPLKGRSWPNHLNASFAAILNPNSPQIVINPGGEMTAFQLYFGTDTKPRLLLITGKSNGDLRLDRGKE